MKGAVMFVVFVLVALFALPLFGAPLASGDDSSELAATLVESERALSKAAADVKAARSLAAIATAQRQQVQAVATRQAVATVQALASERQSVAASATVTALNAAIAQTEATRTAVDVESARRLAAALRDEQLAAVTSGTAQRNAQLYGWLLPALGVLLVFMVAVVGVAALNQLLSVRVQRERFTETSGGILDTAAAEFVRRELPAWSMPESEVIDAMPKNTFVLNGNGRREVVLKELTGDRARALRLLRDAIETNGAQSNLIPSWRALAKAGRRYNADSWSRAVAFLKAYGVNANGNGTTSSKPLAILYSDVGTPRLSPVGGRGTLAKLPTTNRTEHSEQNSERANGRVSG